MKKNLLFVLLLFLTLGLHAQDTLLDISRANTLTFIAPSTGGPFYIRITARGGDGGRGNQWGGSGATMSGIFKVENGEQILAISGESGEDYLDFENAPGCGGGGGGSGAVNLTTGTIMIIAAGGQGGGGSSQHRGSRGIPRAGNGDGGAAPCCSYSSGGGGGINGPGMTPSGNGGGSGGGQVSLTGLSAGGLGADGAGNGGAGMGGGGGGAKYDGFGAGGGGQTGGSTLADGYHSFNAFSLPGGTCQINKLGPTCCGGYTGRVIFELLPTTTFWKDADGDGYGDPNASTTGTPECSPEEYVTNNTDCNDNDADIHAFKQYYIDTDRDGYGSTTTAMLCSSTAPDGYSDNNTDCNDNDADINPNTIWAIDNDNDSHTPELRKQCESPGPEWFVRVNEAVGDCDDNNTDIYFGAPELCDGIDNNCNNIIDEGAQTVYYRDADGDGFGNYSDALYACSQPAGYITYGNDCDDSKPKVHPGAKEICDGIDNNCDGNIDDGCSACTNATNLTTTKITSGSAMLNWNASVNPVKWQIRYKKNGAGSQWILITVPGSYRSLTISPLDANTKYVWQIRAKCNGGVITSYTDNTAFKTLRPSQQFVNNMSIEQSITKTVDGRPAIKLYPNPTRGQFIIKLHLAGNINTVAQIELVNLIGQTVSGEGAVISNGVLQKTMFISPSLTSGMYMVKVSANGKIYLSKLIYEK